uniref:Uncharacterized protein n=1 Tax=Pararge aegeria TaxID=116150 RepID=S4PI41_9NEOP
MTPRQTRTVKFVPQIFSFFLLLFFGCPLASPAFIMFFYKSRANPFFLGVKSLFNSPPFQIIPCQTLS